MKKNKLSHVDPDGNPQMVDVSGKAATVRTAQAQAVIRPGKEILNEIKDNELITKKGPVFHTAIIAGVMGAKHTSNLIPFCHPIAFDDCQVRITVKKNKIVVDTRVAVTAKTGAEMEALTAATIAALTIYDMCKAISKAIVIEEIKLVAKTGGKRNYTLKPKAKS